LKIKCARRSARVLAGKCVAMSLPARTRALRSGATDEKSDGQIVRRHFS
jgi:hypothetical protein